jgi:hypothetical protein
MQERRPDMEETRILLGLLDSVERDDRQTYRRLAAEVGIALGLTNAYLRRCIKKGLVKVRRTPARRYAYYLTPRGFAEKSRLTAEYLSYSLYLFREARNDCSRAFAAASGQSLTEFALIGCSDIAEIATICATEQGVHIACVLDTVIEAKSFVGAPVVRSYRGIPRTVQAVLITNMKETSLAYQEAAVHFDDERIFIPQLLHINRKGQAKADPG